MPIQVFAHHMQLPDDLRARVVEKAQHIRRIFDGVVTVHVTLDAEKERRLVEVVANVSHGAPVVARVTTQNLAEAIELAFDKAEAQLRKHKDRIRDHRPREHGVEVPPPTSPDADEEAGEEPAGKC
ncbi:MAG TPA: ribosome-associated translation inhibitor RaiA [Planctomycetota bacterium]|nr:ribosome-associated translation inhibitor RaiA [Planctomycetota bacterium]HRR80962.1 ribosome-associated translation inhibitor RaiA [Planctomycetota bacterium]HRT94654.1 ribosome-associated translation inhibitor RaiA [Planctomycetota bacterium]